MGRSIVDRKSRSRVSRAWWVIASIYTLLLGRIVWLQSVDADDLRERASFDRKSETNIPAERGRILDRNGREMAINVDVCEILIHPSLIRDKKTAAEILAKHLGMDKAVLYRKLTHSKKYFTLAEAAPAEAEQAIKRAILHSGKPDQIRGVDIRKRSVRRYPMGAVASKLIGAVNSKSVGITGIEKNLNAELAGKPGVIVAACDRTGRPIPNLLEKAVQPVAGRDIVLTIDSRIQYAAEQALFRQIKAFGATGGSCIVMDPVSGDILAMAEYPGFNPASVKKITDDLRVHALENIYEPGSTMKLITAAIALRHGLSGVTSRCVGAIDVGTNKKVRCPCHVRDREPGAPVTIARMLKYSCNTESTTLARRLGSKLLYDEIRNFGLLSPLHIRGMEASAVGLTPDPHKYSWSQARLANVSFGQGIATSRFHMLSAYAVVANGGWLIRPRLVKSVTDGSYTPSASEPADRIRKVMTAEQSERLLGYLKDTVDDGTGKNARIAGFDVGGKTGSAQMPKAGGKGFEANAYLTSFIGIAPLNEPKVVALVAIERPKGSTHGSVVAAPVFKEVTERTMWYRGAESKQKLTRGSVPSVKTVSKKVS